MLTSCLNANDQKISQTLPTTRQQHFNKIIENVSKNYSDSYKSAILNCKCSEPLPSNPYALPKDHKPGILKGRPIISTVNSSVRKLSIWIASLLNPLVKKFVEAHLS